MRKYFLYGNLILIPALAIAGYFFVAFWWVLLALSPFLLMGFYDMFQPKHSIRRNFPLLGRMRFILEGLGPEIHQYFIESNTDGTPIDRNHRTYVYSRAKHQAETHPFGTQLDVKQMGYEWMQHSIYPAERLKEHPRVLIGGSECKQPYSASVFNISAMSYGALSKNAVAALNLGAKAGGFYHNTGEGGISDYHLQGADIVYQLGTGYFGSRSEDGTFNEEKFKVLSSLPNVKMIELKLSQGAKPGHGGVLPAAKNTLEIAKIRGVKPFTAVLSPPGHREFNSAEGLLKMIKRLRDLSGAKPVGFKLCIGSRDEFIEICQKMVELNIKPDFITVDGGEGGTGAAPIDFSNYVGMPWEEAVIFVSDTLNTYGLKKDIKIITATKVITSFDIYKALCLGADLCNSARGMMLALGCIQALQCDKNTCPTGVATNNPDFVGGLVVADKWERVKNYHNKTVDDFCELLAASGVSDLEQLDRNKIHKRVDSGKIVSFAHLYPEPSVDWSEG